MKFSLLITIFLVLLSPFILAQTGSIKGTVIERRSGNPVPYANVYLKGTNHGAVTDDKGFYMISKVPAGEYRLAVQSVGFDSMSVVVTVSANEVVSKKLIINESVYTLDVAEITAEQMAKNTDTRISVVKVTAKQINKIPTVGGQADFAQYLQVVPGVVFTGDQGGQLYIRGGTPVQNLVLLDGMTVYNPFHSIGLFSVFDADLISSADVYTGGFGAEYGGRISSVMDVSYRYGNTKKVGGKADFSVFGSKIILEGPLVKETDDPNKGSISFVLSAKNSFLETSSKALYPYINDGTGIPFSFSDYYGKISFNASNGNRADIFGFNFNDQVTYKTINNYSWNSYGGGAKFSIVPGTSPVLMEGMVSFSNYEINMDDGSGLERNSEIGGFNMGLNFTYFLGKNRLKYGVEMKGSSTDYNFVNSLNRTITQEESTTELNGFVSYKMNLGSMGSGSDNSNDKFARFIIVPGLRIQYYASLDNVSIEPRFSMKYNINTDWRLKVATGFFSQNLISTASDRDVVNLFYGFVSGPDNLQDEFNGEVLTHKLQKAIHYIAGLEYDFSKRITFNLEAYYKDFTQLTNINRNKVFDDTQEYLDRPDELKKDFIVEVGYAQGVDVSLKYDYRRAYFWAVYSLGFNHRFDGLIEYTPHFDRRHNVNLLFTYSIGKKLNWEIDARWNYGSGFPFTPTAGNYEILTFDDGIGTDYTVSNGTVGTVYGAINSSELPSYHRLDIGLKRKFYLKKDAELEANIGVTNIYNRANIFYIDRVTKERIDQLPIMISGGINFKF